MPYPSQSETFDPAMPRPTAPALKVVGQLTFNYIIAEGWECGSARDDATKRHPCLVPYGELPESEKEYDRSAALETLKAIAAIGYRIERA